MQNQILSYKLDQLAAFYGIMILGSTLAFLIGPFVYGLIHHNQLSNSRSGSNRIGIFYFGNQTIGFSIGAMILPGLISSLGFVLS